MRRARARVALVLLAACLAVPMLLLPRAAERRPGTKPRTDGEDVPLPPGALARLRIPYTGKPIASDDPRRGISPDRFTDDGRTLVVWGADGTLSLWDWRTGYQRRCWHTAQAKAGDWPLPIQLSPDGRILAEASDDQTVRLRDINTNRELRTLRTAATLWSLHFSPDGEILVSLALKGTQLWSVRTGAELQIGPGHIHAMDLALFSPERRWFVFQEGVVICDQWPNEVYFWDVCAKCVRHVIKSYHFWHSLHEFSPDGRMVVGAENSRADRADVVLWEAATGSERLRRQAWGGPVSSMALSSDGRTLALGCGDNTIRLWDVVKGDLTQCFVCDPPIGHIVFSADGERLASCGPGRTILIWDVARGSRSVETAARLSRQELNELWGNLGADAACAFKAQRALAAAPRSALELLTERLRPVVPPEPERVRRLITDLDSDSYTVREQAMGELRQLGDGTEAFLRQAREQRPSLELRRRIDRLLEGLAADSAEHLQVDRALEVLEWLDTPESPRLLRMLGGGARGAWRTAQAEAALRRLDRRRPVARRP